MCKIGENMKKNVLAKTGILLLFISSIVILGSCSQEKQKVAKESNEPERNSERYIEIAKDIANQTFTELSTALGGAIKEEGFDGAVNFCSLEALSITRQSSEKYGSMIRRVSNKYRNPANQPDSLETFALNILEKSNANHFLVNDTENKIVNVFLPIRVKDACLNCHGDMNKDINPKTMSVINQKYPNDLAVGYKLDELRGAWSIKLPMIDIKAE